MMNHWILYIVKVNICFTCFYVIYWAFFRNLTFYSLNRAYLLAIIFFAFVIPLLHYELNPDKSYVSVVYTITNTLNHHQLINTGVSAYHRFDQLNLLAWGVIAGMFYFAILFMYRMASLYAFNKKYSAKVRERAVLITYFNIDRTPFSFLNRIFVNPALYSKEEFKYIMVHEEIHARHLHSLDILFVEIFKIVSWFNPFVWIYSKAVKQNLEYLTDNKILEIGYDAQRYQLSLLQVFNSRKVAFPVNYFAATTFKKRLFMMNRVTPSSKGSILKYLSVLPTILLLLFVFNSTANYKVKRSSYNFFSQIASDLDLHAKPPRNAMPKTSQVVNPSVPLIRLKKQNLQSEKELNRINVDSEIANTENTNHDIPPGAHWHAEMTGDAIVNISGGKISIDGENGMALIKNRDRLPSKYLIKNYPEAVFVYQGKEYPIDQFQDVTPFDKIKETDIYLGSFASEKYGGKPRCVVSFEFND